MGEDHAIILDPMAPPLPTAVSSETVVFLNGNGTAANGPESHQVDSHKVESGSVVSPEDNTSKIQSESLGEEDSVCSGEKESFKVENGNGLANSSTLACALGDAPPPQEEPSDDHLPQEAVKEEGEEAVVDPQDTAERDEGEKVVVVVKQDEAPDAMDVENQAEIAANSDEQQDKNPDAMDVEKQAEIATSSGVQQDKNPDAVNGATQDAGSDEQPNSPAELGGELVKPEVAHRSPILGSLSSLDETSARQLLTDSGWNVSQSVRQNGRTQWYYRSPPPKPVLVGSLTSAVKLWKKLADADHKRKGEGGDADDLHPMVTTFLNNVKRPASKKARRTRYSE